MCPLQAMAAKRLIGRLKVAQVAGGFVYTMWLSERGVIQIYHLISSYSSCIMYVISFYVIFYHVNIISYPQDVHGLVSTVTIQKILEWPSYFWSTRERLEAPNLSNLVPAVELPGLVPLREGFEDHCSSVAVLEYRWLERV